MDKASKIIKWRNRNNIIDFITVCADEDAIIDIVKQFIIDALKNEPKEYLQKDWSNFGKHGDYIEVEDCEIGDELNGTITKSI